MHFVERLYAIKPGNPRDLCITGAKLRSKPPLLGQVTRRKEENFRVRAACGGFALCFYCGRDHQTGSRLDPAGQVIEIGLLMKSKDLIRPFDGSEQDNDSAIGFLRQRNAPRVVPAGVLPFQS